MTQPTVLEEGINCVSAELLLKLCEEVFGENVPGDMHDVQHINRAALFICFLFYLMIQNFQK